MRLTNINFLVTSALVLVIAATGCEKSAAPEFRLNSVEWIKQERLSLPTGEHFAAEYKTEIGTILLALFGTPDEPRFPFFDDEESPAHDILSLGNLQAAAGPVDHDQKDKLQGLYREHCSHCHGISGDGAGPTAQYLNPYPRDFRLGKFKFKSTPLRQPPTNGDLMQLLKNGIPGTAMPSFRTLPDEELNALVDYVKYLTIRGQFERFLMSELASLDGAPILDLKKIKSKSAENKPTDDDLAEFEESAYAVIADGLLDGIVYRWLRLEKKMTPIPAAPAAVNLIHDGHQELVNQGRALFYSKGNCMQCHGATGVGDGQLGNFDDWTNEWIKTSGVDPFDSSTYQTFVAAGALPPRPIRPRNLHVPMFRGGNHPNDIYLRIANGIEGTPMPSSATLTSAEIWAMVAYVKALPYEDAVGSEHKPINEQQISK